MNSLQTLINHYLSENDISRSEYVKQLGFSNVHKGLRRLDEFFKSPDSAFASLILKVSDIPEDILNNAIQQVNQDRENQRRRDFKPLIRVIPIKRPTPYLAGAVLNIEVPDDLKDLPFDQEIAVVCDLYQKHKEKVNNPLSWASGKGFKYYRNFQETLVFDGDCRLIR